jgi:putative transcriptional regulator
MRKNTHPINNLLREIHHRIEAKERARISQADMAERLGISSRTYLEYLRGTNSPTGMRAILDLLCMLDDQQLNQIIQQWKNEISPIKNSIQENND